MKVYAEMRLPVEFSKVIYVLVMYKNEKHNISFPVKQYLQFNFQNTDTFQSNELHHSSVFCFSCLHYRKLPE
jgi:hypothetical protein